MAAQLQADRPVFDCVRKIRAQLVRTEGDFHVLRADGIQHDWKAHRRIVIQARGEANSAPQEQR